MVTTPSGGEATATTLAAAATAWRDAAVSEDGAALTEVSDEHAARMLMSVKTVTSVLHTRDLIGAHDANFVFSHREACDDLLGFEPQFVFQSILGDTSDVIPGWYWLRDASTEVIRSWTESAFTDSLVVVRRGATEFMGKWPHNPLLPEVYEHFPRLLDDHDEFVRRNTLTAVVALATRGALAMLDAASARVPNEEIADARRFLGLQLRPEAELVRIIDEGKPITSRVRRQAVTSAEQISAETATQGLASSEASIRYACALVLSTKDALDEAASRGLLNDAALGVRRAGLLRLIALGIPVTLQEIHTALDESKSETPPRARFLRDDSEQPKEDEVVAALLDRMTQPQLEEMVHFYLPDGREAYAALVRQHFATRDRFRRDLDEDFATLKNESQERVRRVSPEHADALLKALESSEPYMRSRLIDAVMFGIAEHGDARDLERVRKVLAMPATFGNMEAIAQGIGFLQRFGSREDVPRLIALALQSEGLPHDVQGHAAVLALRLSEHDMSVAEQLLDTAIVAVIDAVFRHALDEGVPDLHEQATSRLHHPNESMRRAAVAYLALRLSRTEAAESLKRYRAEGIYYYNVVKGLDQAAYVPDWLLASLRERLQASLQPPRSFREVFVGD
jgi:hypothetical protein